MEDLKVLTGHSLGEAHVLLNGVNRLFVDLNKIQDLQPGGMAQNLQQPGCSGQAGPRGCREVFSIHVII